MGLGDDVDEFIKGNEPYFKEGARWIARGLYGLNYVILWVTLAQFAGLVVLFVALVMYLFIGGAWTFLILYSALVLGILTLMVRWFLTRPAKPGPESTEQIKNDQGLQWDAFTMQLSMRRAQAAGVHEPIWLLRNFTPEQLRLLDLGIMRAIWEANERNPENGIRGSYPGLQGLPLKTVPEAPVQDPEPQESRLPTRDDLRQMSQEEWKQVARQRGWIK